MSFFLIAEEAKNFIWQEKKQANKNLKTNKTKQKTETPQLAYSPKIFKTEMNLSVEHKVYITKVKKSQEIHKVFKNYPS